MMKRNFRTVLLRELKGGFHFSRGVSNNYDKSEDYLHSDALKAALFSCAMQLYPSLAEEENGKLFMNSFKISSAFPFIHNGNKTYYFLPKPTYFKLSIDGADPKKLKNLKFIESSLYSALLRNELTVSLDNLIGEYLVSTQTKQELIPSRIFNVLDNSLGISRNKPYQHVYISSDWGDDAKPYYVDKIFFDANAGLYILLECNDEKVEQQVYSAFKLLSDSGIGMDRNTGNGQFSFDQEYNGNLEIEVPKSEQSNYELSLSMYCPLEKEISNQLNKSYFSIKKRGGYISSPDNHEHLTIRKRSVYMFTEGSLFPKMEEIRTGKLVNLRPKYQGLDHPIWRDGQAIFLPILIQK